VYIGKQLPVRSRGCAYAPIAVDPAMVHTANLRLRPAEGTASEADLLASIDNGIFFSIFAPVLDFQQLSGYGIGTRCYEIKKGNRTARLVNAGALFRTPELWKSIQALGGMTSAKTIGMSVNKGQPQQQSVHSVTAVPAIVKDLSVIDYQRKA